MRDQERRPQAPLALGGDVRRPARHGGSSVRPLPVPDQVAEVVPPAVVGRRGVAVPEVAVVARSRSAARAERARSRRRQRPEHPTAGLRARRWAHGLTAARNTEEPNGRSRRASTRSSSRHSPSRTRSRPGPTCGYVDHVGRLGAAPGEPVPQPRGATRSADEHREDRGEAVGRPAHLEAGRPRARPRPAAGCSAGGGRWRRRGRSTPTGTPAPTPAAGRRARAPGGARAGRGPRARSARSRRRRVTTSKLASPKGSASSEPHTPGRRRRPRGSRSSDTLWGASSQPTLGPSALPTSSSRSGAPDEGAEDGLRASPSARGTTSSPAAGSTASHRAER